MSPSCALAEFRDGHLTVRSHGQGMHPLRKNLAAALGLPEAAITAQHLHGAGCYGHNGADDPPIDAALIAVRRPGPPIRVQWRREDEFGYAPVGTAMLMELPAELDASGRLVDYTAEIWNTPHTGARGTARRAAGLAGPTAAAGARSRSMPDGSRFSGGTAERHPLYDIPGAPSSTWSIRRRSAPRPCAAWAARPTSSPPRASSTSWPRPPAGPVAYRLAMLSDPRGRAVLEQVGEMCRWSRARDGGTGRGLGLAYDRHRGAGLRRRHRRGRGATQRAVGELWCACDGGLIINPDGARNQLEGGMVMAASWTLKEQVKLGGRRHRLERLGRLSDPPLHRGARDAGRVRRRRRQPRPGRR